MYAEIIDNNVVNIHNSLPQYYGNISNFCILSDQDVSDLSWANLPNVKFYKYAGESIPDDGYNYEVVYTINNDTKTVSSTLNKLDFNVPSSVTATQIRLWLIDHNIPLANIEAAIESISDPTLKEKTRVQWEYAPYIERNHILIDSLGSQLGLTSNQIDIAFLEASKL